MGTQNFGNFFFRSRLLFINIKINSILLKIKIIQHLLFILNISDINETAELVLLLVGLI